MSESVPLLPSTSATIEYGGLEPKIHSGYGASRIPIKPSISIGLAGSNYDKIHQQQLGVAASTGNQLNLFKSRDEYYDSIPIELRQLGFQDRQEKIKPYGVSWNKESKQQYKEHWKLVNPRAGQKRVNSGFVLPFSNNIGPGNTVQEALNPADKIAQGHDISYSNAKSDKDIQDSDTVAIGQFVQEAVGGSNPISSAQAIVGAVGLAGKSLIERIAGKAIYGKYATWI